jgi:chemotaxis protein CheZ
VQEWPHRDTFFASNNWALRGLNGRSARRTSRDLAILRELGALRTMLAPVAAAPNVNSSRARQSDTQKLVAELRLVLAAIRGQRGERNGGPATAPARIADELDAVIQDSDIAAQRILTAAEHIDQAANNLVGLLKGNFERGLAQDIRDRVTQIFEACNFQDLTSQRRPRLGDDTGHVSQSDIDSLFDGDAGAAR